MIHKSRKYNEKRFVNLGFTLIELLVVVAIIGILASVILASLSDARDEGINAKLKSEVDSIVKRAAIENSRSFTYDTVCGSNSITQSPEIATLIASINILASSSLQCNSTTAEFAVSVPIGDIHWCADSIGTKQEMSAALTNETLCP